MEIIFKKGSKQIEHVENAEKLTYEKQNELIEKYDNEDIVSYEIRFKPDIKVSVSHDFDNIKPEKLKSIIITIGKVAKCPKCGSDKIRMFDSDNDQCVDCGHWDSAGSF